MCPGRSARHAPRLRSPERVDRELGPRADLYREAETLSSHSLHALDIAVASHGFVAVNATEAKRRYFEYESQAFAAYAAEHDNLGPRGRTASRSMPTPDPEE